MKVFKEPKLIVVKYGFFDEVLTESVNAPLTDDNVIPGGWEKI